MTCRAISPLLYAERDGVLAPEQHAELDRHCTACVGCQQLRAELAAAAAAWRAQVATVAVPNADAEWRKVQSMIHAPTAAKRKRKLAPIIWLSAPLAAAAAIAFAFFVNPTPPAGGPPPPPPPAPEVAATDAAHADFVETGDANASTMVYVDKDSGWLVVWASDADAKTSG